MNSFKKGIACVLAALLLITAMPIISFAAPVAIDGQTIALNETLVVEITEPNQVVRLYFTPEVSGIYQFRSFEADGDPVGYIADANEDGIFAEGDDTYWDCNFEINCYLGAGETYTLGAKMWSEHIGSYSVCVTEQAEFEYEVNDGETATITGYNGEGGEVSIPSALDGYSVSAIGFEAFYGCNALTAVEIPNTVTEVVYNAFAWCNQLAEVYLPTSVTYIEEQAFDACNSLKTVCYSGSESERYENLSIGWGNEALTSAKWVYNSCAMGKHEFDGEDDATCNNCPYTVPVYRPIELDETQSVTIENPGEEALFRFTPTVSGTYSFFSFNNTMDTYGYIADANGRELVSDDDSGDDNNFSATCMLEAGKTYTLCARAYSNERTGTFDVKVQQFEIISVDFHDVEIIAGANAETRVNYDYVTGTEVEWEYYPEWTYRPTYTATLRDGRTVEGSGNIYVDGKEYFTQYLSGQSFRTPWVEGGQYTVTGSVLNGVLTDTFTVTLIGSPVVSVTVPKRQIVENTNGHYITDGYYDENGQEVWLEYFHYESYHPQDMVITLTDGTVIEGSNFEWNGQCFDADYWNNQSYENQWTVGNTYEVEAKIAGYEFTYEVEIIESPVASVTVPKKQIIENTNGYYTTDWYYDENKQEVQTPEYYYYNSYFPYDAVITLTDGTVIEGSSFEWNGQWFYIGWGSNQSYQNQWTAGNTYAAEADIAGYEFTYEVEIIESPVASVTVPKMQIVEKTNGYYENGYYDYETDEWVSSPPYFYYESYRPQDMVITLTDGTVIEDNCFEWNGQWFYVDYWSNQSYVNQWTAGNTYEVEAKIAGYEFTYEVEIIKSPIASVTIPKVVLIEGVDGSYKADGYYNGPDDFVPTSPEYFWYHYGARDFVVTMSDGTVYENEGVSWEGQYYSLSCSAEQSYENQWTAGNTYTATAEIFGFVTTYEVEIVENPVAAIIVEPQQHAEHTNGRWTTDWISTGPDADGWQTPEYFEYWVNPDSYTIVFKDGTTKQVYAGEGVEIAGTWHYLNWGSDQSYENQWGVGVHTAWADFCGVTTEYTVEITQLSANDMFEYMVSEDGVIITDSYVYDVETLEIPEEIDGKPVIGVAYLRGTSDIRHLVFPDSVQTIGDYVLECFWNLETVTFGSGVNNLTPEMFYNNENLYRIVVSSANLYFCVGEDGVLYNRAMDTFIAYPQAMGDTYIVPTTVTNTEALNAWCYDYLNVRYSDNHPHFVTIDGVTYTRDMTKVVMCEKDKEGIYIMPDTVTEIAAGAFENCDKLTGVVVSPGVTEIVYYTFASCSSLASVELPEGLISIDQSAFEETTSLTSIELPSTLTIIGEKAFYDSGLTALTVPDSVCGIDYLAFAYSDIVNVDLGEGVAWISDSAFLHTPITSVVLPDSLTYLGGNAFYGCGDLKTAEIGTGLEYILSETFCCTGLTSVTLPKNVGHVDRYAFAYSDLTSVVFENPEVSLGTGAFRGCPLKSLQLGDQMKEIGKYTFAETDITELDIPDSVTHIVYGAFADCEFLADIRIPTTVEDIGGHTFDNTAWHNAQEDGVTYLGHIAYNWKGGMAEDTAVTLQEGTTVIADYAFEHQANMTAITLPSTLRVIGDYAFYGCTGLTSIHIPANVVEIGYGAFACSGIETVTVDPANAYYTVIDGALYTTDGTLVLDPAVKDAVSGVYLEGSPYKQVYQLGEEFDPTGMEVWVEYESGRGMYVTSGYIVKGFDSSVPGEQWVYVSYGGRDSGEGFWVTILDNGTTEPDPDVPVDPDPDEPIEPDVTLQYIDIYSNPNKTVYEVGEEFDPTGLVLELYYSDGSRELVESGYTIDGFDSSVPGDCWPHVSYGGCTVYKAFRLVVEDNSTVEPTITDIRVYPSEQNDIVLGVTYSDGTTQIVTDGFTVTGFDPEAVGVQEVTVTYNGFTKVFHLIVNEEPLVEIETILVDPDASNGLKVTVVYSDGTTEDITSGYTVEGFDPAATGDQEITVTYEGITKTFTVKVADAPVVDENKPTFVVDDATARAGDTFTVAVRTENNPGITSMKLKIGYDSEILEFVSIEWKDFTGGVTGTSPTDSNPFIINWANTLSGNNTTDGTVALLTFKVKDGVAAGSTALSLSYDADDVYDANYENVTFATVDGTVNVIEYISGDVNGDNKINNKDLGLLLQYLNNWDVNVVKLACDVNRDGKINNKDLGILLQYLNNWNVELK